MNIQLIKGDFSPADTIDLITQMIHVKIKYHENKISQQNNQEDTKMREAKIKQLQKDLLDLRNNIGKNSGNVSIESKIILNP
ncbi:MAG: hypothetical protein JNJ41_10105 [Bacteroidia bacterium]|nr:hypothetical protein [Bacteroidia bacterium]